MRTYGKLNPNDKQANKGNNRANDACEIKLVPKTASSSAVRQSSLAIGNHYQSVVEMDATDLLEGFVWFIEEREAIRLKKEAGEERPWTTDEVLDKTKFTNIFRIDDKVSRFIFEKVEGLSGSLLTYNLLLGRLINRVDILSKVLPAHPTDNLEFLFEGEGVIMNSAAYQICPRMAHPFGRNTIREVIVYDTKNKHEAVHSAITSTSSIEEAVKDGNKAWGGYLSFAMMQVVCDLQHLTNCYDEPSTIRVGQGGKAVIDCLLGIVSDKSDIAENVRAATYDLSGIVAEVNKRVKRPMTAIDVEHAACEYRKYLYRQGKVLSRYSYKPNSMGIQEK